jgi:hypothetical protein
MDLNSLRALVETSAVETSGQDERLQSLTAADAFEFAPRSDEVQWELADPAEFSARIPRLGALFGKVA